MVAKPVEKVSLVLDKTGFEFSTFVILCVCSTPQPDLANIQSSVPVTKEDFLALLSTHLGKDAAIVAQ